MFKCLKERLMLNKGLKGYKMFVSIKSFLRAKSSDSSFFFLFDCFLLGLQLFFPVGTFFASKGHGRRVHLSFQLGSISKLYAKG